MAEATAYDAVQNYEDPNRPKKPPMGMPGGMNFSNTAAPTQGVVDPNFAQTQDFGAARTMDPQNNVVLGDGQDYGANRAPERTPTLDGPDQGAQRTPTLDGPDQTATPEMTPQEANAAGLGWVPKDHPSYGKPGFVGSQGGTPTGAGTPAPGQPPTGSTPYGTTPGSPAGEGNAADQAIIKQARNSETNSATPGAATSQVTGNQGSQDVLRNTLLEQIVQKKTPDASDPIIKGQLDAYSAQRERMRRDQVDDSAEALGPMATGQLAGERRLAGEKASQDIAGTAATLVGREQTARREEIKHALDSMGELLSNDQRNALTKELANLDASIKMKGLEQTGQIGNRELDIREALGRAGLSNDLISTLLRNQQVGNQQGIDVGSRQADIDLQAMRASMGL